LRDDSDSFSEFSQDLDIDIIERIDPDVKMSGPDLSDSCNNSDDGKASGNVGGDGVNGGGGGGYSDKNDNGDWALWSENNHDFYIIPFRASYDYIPP
jgi:hypothetical protein